jgi:hypothetical protein
MKEFILKIVNEEGVVHELPIPVAKHEIIKLMNQDGVQKEVLLTLENHIRLSIPVSDKDAEWIGKSN